MQPPSVAEDCPYAAEVLAELGMARDDWLDLLLDRIAQLRPEDVPAN